MEDALLQEIKHRNDIVSVVSDYVSLKKAGNHFKGLCPFHNEKTPSFTVHPGRQFFHCFGCQASGDVISFVREMGGHSFMEAVRHLADRAGIVIPERSGREQSPAQAAAARKRRAEKRALKDECYAIGAAAQRYFREMLQVSEGQSARDYLSKRGLSRETLESYGVGYAPDGWDGLLERLRREGFDLDSAETVGLLVPRKSGSGHYDRFRDRVMFPVRNLGGDVIAFAGRTLKTDKEVAKYVNSPETPVFTKGKTLFGLYESRRGMRDAGYAVVVEGQVDVLSMAQAGLPHTVAPMGTALTEEQCRLLRRLVPRVVLLYDGDKAGRAAAIKAIPTALAMGLEVRVALLPDGEDPDSYAKSEGGPTLQRLVDRAIGGWDHLVDHVLDDTGALTSDSGRVQAIDRLAPALQGLPDARLRELHQGSLARALGMSADQLASFMRRSRAKRRQVQEPQRAQAPRQRPAQPPPHLELALFSLMLRAPEACAIYIAHDIGELLQHAGLKAAADALTAAWEETEHLDVTAFLNGVRDEGVRVLSFRSLAEAPVDFDWRVELDRLETRLRSLAHERRRREVSQAQQRASRQGDEEAALQLLQAKLELERTKQRAQDARRGTN